MKKKNRFNVKIVISVKFKMLKWIEEKTGAGDPGIEEKEGGETKAGSEEINNNTNNSSAEGY